MLGDSLGFIYGIQVVCTEGTELCSSGGRVIGTTVATYNGTEIGLSRFSSDGTAD